MTPTPAELQKPADARPRLTDYGAGFTAAVTFAAADILTKLVLADGADVLTLALVRSVIGIFLVAVWLRTGPTPVPLATREKWTAALVGLLYAIIIYLIFRAIELLTVPMAILTYFSYPLLTALIGARLGIEKLGVGAIVVAGVAFCGLGLMIGANPGHLGLQGVVFALLASLGRVGVLLVSRVGLMRADARLSTWYSNLTTTVLFALAALLTQNWVPPQSGIGWVWVVLIGITTTTSVAAIFVSTTKIGPFRTALAMNLEPLLVTILSAAFLGELFTPLQAVGAAVMIVSLFVFQLKR
ncbi:Uncharacterized protein DUF6, transmembrane [Rhodovulum sp. PH10]|uniref:DMT family transporter n=1 Tax=Rhodovulum sp. PH10 TaxID=1187851 RepID=UPI00027C225D|nr:EamA family transporter [Rhodovulum sp. PH10]EJW09599.1 Uncharacterized protein DUF6, transmembrane [Rhodovulum sp. PH10]